MGFFAAVVDGEFIPKAPEELLAAKEFSAVPYLLGVNNDEYGWIIPSVSCAPCCVSLGESESGNVLSFFGSSSAASVCYCSLPAHRLACSLLASQSWACRKDQSQRKVLN